LLSGIALHNVAVVGTDIAAELIKGEDMRADEKLKFAQQLFIARDTIREELGIEALPPPPS
jgi:hypothetical protein